MPATKQIAERIVRARVTPGQLSPLGRPVAHPNPRKKLDAIFQEIEETLLPRKLSFTIGEGHSLHMDVGTRRMYQLVGVELDKDTSALKLAFATRDLEQLKDQVSEIAQILKDFVTVPGEMSVSSRLTSTNYRSSEVGFNSTELRKLVEGMDVPDEDEAIVEAPAEPEPDIIEDIEPAEAEVVEPTLEDGEVTDVLDEAMEEPEPEDGPGLEASSVPLEERLKGLLDAAGSSDKDKAAEKAAAAKPAAPPPPATIEEYFEACKSCATNGVLLANDGAVLAVFGRGVQENWLDIAGHAAEDFSRWIDVAGWALGKSQQLVLKGQHFEDSSIAVLFKDNKYAAITMRNLDLNKVMKLGMEVLAQGAET